MLAIQFACLGPRRGRERDMETANAPGGGGVPGGEHLITRSEKRKNGKYQDFRHGLCLERALRHWSDLGFQLCFPAATHSCSKWLA